LRGEKEGEECHVEEHLVELQEATFYVARRGMAILDLVHRGENDAQLHHPRWPPYDVAP
jgi:hypothetical protein